MEVGASITVFVFVGLSPGVCVIITYLEHCSVTNCKLARHLSCEVLLSAMLNS